MDSPYVRVQRLTMKVAHNARRISLARRERVGVRETVTAAAICIFMGGAAP
jgi:hypothetical protein